MAGQKLQSIWELVARQHGVVARWQLLAHGMSRHGVEHRMATGRLHAVMRGIYAVGRPELTREGRWMAAVLACGPDAALSHSSGAALWAIVKPRHGAIEVTVPATAVRKRPGIVVHRRTLGESDVTEWRGIRWLPSFPRWSTLQRNSAATRLKRL